VLSKYLDTATSIATLVASLAMVAVIGQRAWTMSHRPTPPQPFKAGDAIPRLPGLDPAKSERTLVMVLRHDCKYCAASLPFYRDLAKQFSTPESSRRVQLVVVMPDEPDVARDYVDSNKLQVTAVIPLSPDERLELRVRGTPTLLLADKTGRIKKVWTGQLDSSQQDEVRQALSIGTPAA